MKYRIRIGETEHAVTVLARTESSLSFETGGKRYDVAVEREPRPPERRDSTTGHRRTPTGSHRGSPGEVRAPMPGVVVELCCAPGSPIEAGAPVIVIEAMKMENCITAGRSGVVKEIRAAVGQQVGGGDLLVVIE